MRGFVKSKGFKILLSVTAVLVALTVLSYALGSWMAPQSSVLGAIVTPIQRLTTSLSNSISDFLNAGARADELEKENNLLRNRIQELTSSLIEYL